MQFDPSTTNHWLPTFPAVAIRVLEKFADEEVAVVDLANEIKVDPVLTTRILHVANSPAFRARSEIATLEHAISWLGKPEVAGLVLSFKLASFASDNKREARYFNEFWRQSFIQGCAMSRIAMAGGQILQGEAYVCGLLLDFGRLLMLDGYPGGYGKIIDESCQDGIALHKLEEQRLGICHAQIGDELLRSMGLPERYGEVAANHTLSFDELADYQDNPNFNMIAAAVASSAVGDFFCRNNQADSLSTTEAVCRRYLMMTETDIEWLMDSVRQDIEEKADLFAVDIDDMPPIGQLLGQANSQIERLSMSFADRSTSDPANEGETSGENNGEEDGEPDLEREVILLRKLVNSLEDKVCKDTLTGIFNRDYFTGRFHERINHLQTDQDKFAFMMIDIDDFKSINDNHGHIAGDNAITWTATFINAFFKSGLVARFGGDEFVVLMDFESESQLAKKLQELCDLAKQLSPSATGRPTPITISVGAVACKIDQPHASLPMHILNLADMAMFEAKRAGGGQGKVVSIDEIPDAWNGCEDSNARFGKLSLISPEPPISDNITEARA